MAKPIRFTPKKTKDGWRINIPPKISETGRRQQLFYRTQALALEAAGQLKAKVEAFGSQARAISASLSEQAVAAENLLAPWKISLIEAAQMVVAIKERDNASRTIDAATETWLAACEGLRPRTVRNYRLTAEKLTKALSARLMSSISADEIQGAIAPAGSGGASVAEQIRNAKAFWRYSAAKGWCEAKTFDGVEMPKASREGDEIEILTPEDVSTLLSAAERHFPQAVASFALQLFAGIRAEEIVRMEKQHVTADGIDLPASVTKKGRRRHITPSPTLDAWLKAYPFEPCSNWRETSAACRRLAGWDVSARILNDRIKAGKLEPLEPAGRGKWPQNALRHTHASFAVATGTPLENLLFEFGHSGSPTLLRQHYVGRASKKQALEFFSIGPRGSEIPAINAA
jgi:integrase